MSAPAAPSETKPFSEGRFLLILGLVQFINTLDFIMVMPLGPDFAASLNIPVHHLGYIGGSYMFAAAVSGLIGAFFLDWFDRKKALQWLLFGLGFATILPCFATNLETLIGARLLAGLFGGPLTACCYAMLADVIPPSRRGSAMGKVMGAFSAASVLGIPFGLELARHFGWQAPFASLGVIAWSVLGLAYYMLPANVNEKAEQDISIQWTKIKLALQNPLAWSSWGYTAVAVIAGFMIIPNLAAHVQGNMHFPREKLSLLYLVGGFVSFFGMRLVGIWVDKTTATNASIGSTVLFCLTLYFGFIDYTWMPAFLLFIGFMVANTARNVAGQTLSSQVPLPKERAGFMSIQSTITHACCAIGAFMGSMILKDGPNNTLLHVDTVGYLAIALSVLVPVLFWNTERLLNNRARQVKPDPVVAAVAEVPPA